MSIEPEMISLLDRAVLKIEFIDTQGDAADIPAVEGLKIEYRGPQTQYSFINGRSTSSITHTYLVTPSKVGDFSIGPVKVKYREGEKSLSTRLRVIKPQDDAQAQQLSEIMFSEITADRESPYVHEPFHLYMKVYIRDGVEIDGQFGIQGGLPETGMDGELQWRLSGPRREERNGAIYRVYLFDAAAKALTAGGFVFRPEVQVNVVVPRQQRRSWGFEDPFFGDFFGRQETRPIVLDCNRLEVEVKPIPLTGRPDSFTGGVGILDFQVDVEPAHIRAGEPVTVRMRISGEGNLEKITPPAVMENPSIKVYDANPIQAGKPGEIVFEQVIIPTSDSIDQVPPISFSYFNTQTSDFRTITRGPFPITVDPAPQQSAQVVAANYGSRPQETRVLGHDIAYLKPMPERWRRSDDQDLLTSRRFRVILVLPALAAALTGLAVYRRNRLAGNVALARRQKAPKAARRHIQQAQQAIRAADSQAFYQAVWNALTEYFGHRFNLAPGEVTLQRIRDRLKGDPGTIDQLFSTIEHRRYGIGSGQDTSKEEMQQILRSLVDALKKCERMKQ